ncbi:MAG: hypothetical protein EPN94_02955 [Nitrospirae bacterium]|nr:MAG: hypothetical protein EPN94_02955 [Nitrospirota bacterium]
MHSRYNSLTIFMGLVLLFAMPERAAGHNFIGKVGCFECHEKLPVGKTALLLKTNIEKICMKCHHLEKRLSHPVGVVPKVIVPLDLPLDKDGMVSCVTCHDVHMSAVNKLTGKKTFYLRRTLKGKKFCYSCHTKLPSKF